MGNSVAAWVMTERDEGHVKKYRSSRVGSLLVSMGRHVAADTGLWRAGEDRLLGFELKGSDA